MAEIYVNVYFRHEDPDIHSSLVRLFETDSGDQSREAFVALASEINPERGEGLARAFLRDLDDKVLEMFGFEEVADLSGFCCAGGTFGGGGDRFAAACVKLLYHLCPGIQAQAWGMGDDDPWEFWVKHEDGRLVRHEAEPFNGEDAHIRSTVYRWWHEGLPDTIREGMLNDSDDEDDDCDDDSEPVTEEQYRQWLASHAGGSDFEDDVTEVVMDELVSAFTGALAGLFGGGSARKKAVSADAFDADTLDEATVHAVLDDIETNAQAFDIDGVVKHFWPSLKGTVTTTVEGVESTVPLTHSLYRMSLKLVLREDAQYECDQQIENIEINDGAAVVRTTSDTKYIDPTTSTRMATATEDVYTLEIVDGKVQITAIESKELSTSEA